MNKIENLIKQYCPNGVEFKKLGEVCKFKRGTTITAKDAIEGVVPVIAGGQAPAYYHNVANRTGETISVSSSGAYAGYVAYWTIPVFLSDSFSVNPDPKLLITKYVYYFLKNIQEQIHNSKKGSGVPHVHGSDLDKFIIPLPPLAVQHEIVSILDKFTALEAELEAELEGRRKQYEYYRAKLLIFNEIVGGGGGKWMTFKEIGTMIRGNGLQKKDFTESGVGCIHYGQIYTYYGTFTDTTKSFVSVELAAKLQKVNKGDLIITNTSENVEDVCKTVAWLGDEEIVTGGHATIFKHDQNPKYLAYYTQTPIFMAEKKKYATGTKVIDISARNLEKIKIPIPPLEEQARIVAILDKFDALVNDISAGLPAEIKMRKQQYEYYRNKLLTFEKAA
jgi:type I restriction enzyme S subunit